MYTESKVFEPCHMTPGEREVFAHWLYGAHCEAFTGVSFETFVRYVVSPAALRTRIEAYVDAQGKAVGYTAMHLYERDLEGREVLVARAESGLHPSLRSGGLILRFIMEELIRARYDFPGAELYYLGCMVSPVSYSLFCRCAPRSWPHPELPTPPVMQQTMERLAESFGLPQVDADRPLIRQIGWSVRQTREEVQLFAATRRPLIRHFLRLNPNYSRGEGLLYLMPLDWETIAQVVRGGDDTLANAGPELGPLGNVYRPRALGQALPSI